MIDALKQEYKETLTVIQIQVYVSNPMIHTWTMLSLLDTFVGCHTKKENVIFIIFKQIYRATSEFNSQDK